MGIDGVTPSEGLALTSPRLIGKTFKNLDLPDLRLPTTKRSDLTQLHSARLKILEHLRSQIPKPTPNQRSVRDPLLRQTVFPGDVSMISRIDRAVGVIEETGQTVRLEAQNPLIGIPMKRNASSSGTPCFGLTEKMFAHALLVLEVQKTKSNHCLPRNHKLIIDKTNLRKLSSNQNRSSVS